MYASFFHFGVYGNIGANSRQGKSILSVARKLDSASEDYDLSYLSQYVIKFQGCHDILQWNNRGNEEDDDNIMRRVHLARFRLCPQDTCYPNTNEGCVSDFGDYVVSLNTFIETYFESKEQVQEYNCENLKENICGCDVDDGDDEECLYSCYNNASMAYCIDDDNDQEYNNEEYAKCTEVEWGGNDDGDDGDYEDDYNNDARRSRRQLEDAEAEEDLQYFTGAYCANAGLEVRMGLFTDDACTLESEISYYNLTGSQLPYSSESLVSTDCFEYMDDKYEFEMYQKAAKCESFMSIAYPTDSACGYIYSVSIVNEDGIIRTESIRAKDYIVSGLPYAISLLTTTVIFLSAYVSYLNTRAITAGRIRNWDPAADPVAGTQIITIEVSHSPLIS